MAPRQLVGPSLCRIEYGNRFSHKHMANWEVEDSNEVVRKRAKWISFAGIVQAMQWKTMIYLTT